MTKKTKTVLLRFARATAALVVGAVAGFIVGPEALEIVPDPYDTLVTMTVAPALLAAEKWLRFGRDPGEGDTPEN